MNLILIDTPSREYTFNRRDPRFLHIRDVLRARVGDTLRVGVLHGDHTTGIIRGINREEVVVEVDWACVQKAPRLSPVTVCIGHPRPPVLTRIWRDAASLGVEEIRVFAGELTEQSYLKSSHWDSLETYLRQGMEQGGFTSPPRVRKYTSLAEALDPPLTGVGLCGSLGNENAVPLWRVPHEVASGEPIWVLVGPERGFTPGEEKHISGAAVLPVSLGPGVLRTETATTILTGVAVSLSRDNAGNPVVP